MKQELVNVFGKVFITITVDQDNRWVHTSWKGYLTEDNVRTGALAYTEAVKKAGFSCVLNDTSEVVGGWDHSLEWVINSWAPQAARAGIRHLAMITNPESFAESSAASFYQKIKAFEVKVFDKLPDASRWLQQYSLAR